MQCTQSLLIAIIIGVFTVLIYPAPSCASSNNDKLVDSNISSKKQFSFGSRTGERYDMTRSAQIAGIFLLLIGGASMIIKQKKTIFPIKSSEKKNKITLLEELSLGAGSNLILVEVEGNRILLCKNQGKIEYLKEINPNYKHLPTEELSFISNLSDEIKSDNAYLSTGSVRVKNIRTTDAHG